MPDVDAAKRAALQAIDNASDDLRALSLDIHAHPELNFEERHAHQVLSDFLEQRGFAVERSAYALDTAFAARSGDGAPTLAVLCEYDALPGIGHACGHNLIAIAAVAAGLGAREALVSAAGTIVVLGSPAEEGGGGKIDLIEHDAFAAVDAAMMLHPGVVSGAWPGISAIRTIEVEYFGRNAHAGAHPWDGVNALDALIMAYNGISVLRQQLPTSARVHGIITAGGDKPNIIPGHTAAEFYVRESDDTRLEALQQRVMACFEAAATATGCRLEYHWASRSYSNLTTNDPMAEAYQRNARDLGRELPDRDHSFAGGSTDMGNVSHLVPSIHPMYAIETDAGNHTIEFTQAAATEAAHNETLLAAKALALTAIDLFTDPALLRRAKEQFALDHSG
jgi:amidohydrolase